MYVMQSLQQGKIGGFGKFQQFVFVLTCYLGLLLGLFTFNPVFLLGIPDHRCSLPGYDNDTFEIQSDEHQALVDEYIPPSDEFTYDRCHVCQTNATNNDWKKKSSENCTISQAVTCNKWVYDTSVFSSTFVTKVGLVCDKELWVANAEMIFYGGMLVGSLASGIVADKHGRKPVIYVSVLIMVASSISLSWAHAYWLFCVVEFFLGGSTIAAFMPAFILIVEITSTKKRIWPGVISDFSYVVGLIILAGVAYILRDWFKIQLYTSLPCVLLVFYWWILPESPRWLLTKGRIKKAEAIIKKMATWNNTKVPDKLFDKNTLEDKEDKDSSFLELFTTRKQLFRTLVIFFNWTVVSLAYFGLGLNLDNLNGDLYLNFAVSGFVEIPACILVILLVDKVGRRRLYCTMMIVGGAACTSTILSTEYEPTDTLTISLSMLGRLCVTAAYAVAYIHSAELFPTVARNAGMGGASVFARLGSMVAPYIVVWAESHGGTLRETLPSLIFGVVSFLSGSVSLLLPETSNKHLPDTVNEPGKFTKSGENDVEKSHNGLYESEHELLISKDESKHKS